MLTRFCFEFPDNLDEMAAILRESDRGKTCRYDCGALPLLAKSPYLRLVMAQFYLKSLLLSALPE
jgi:hypothetical protein